MQRSTCPECKETIGGTNHTLESTNAVATEMDGATAPAYPNQNDLMAQLRQFME